MNLNMDLRFISVKGNVDNIENITIKLKARALQGYTEMCFSSDDINNLTLRYLEEQGLKVKLGIGDEAKCFVVNWG